ncbi:wall-associated receptor kinase 2-like [Aegilops tauschii subsp. strangulata]|uniref:Protein kinase domain-containing protein n=3 Tax=Aegilops tauschii subsp. strangulata TaxID=200361 RepID=A0A453QNF3_AEGTS|nr:wall-associated receptor kinase 2-like isoform X1 [Aegilops tauschii subsp. strangulata]
MGWSLPAGQKLLLLVAVTLILQHSTTVYGSGSSESINMARPGCPDKCGNVSIPYPFGTGKGCFQEPFNVTCHESRAYLASTGVRVLDINLTFGEVRVQNPNIASQCNYTNGTNSTSMVGLSLDPFHKVSNTKNKLISIGCSMLGMIVGLTKGKNQLELPIVNSCFSFCTDASSVDDTTECAGMGCCQSPFPGNISSFNTTSTPIPPIYNATIQSFSPCSYSFIAEVDSFKFDRSYVSSTNFRSKYTEGFPLVLDWVVGNASCSEATKMGSQYACQAMNSQCINVSNGPGYRCNCSQGYVGNPYLQGGCRDINECEPPNQSLYPCKGNCRNTAGSYTCSCPSGFRSDDPKSIPCVRADPNKALKVALGTSAGVVFLMVCMFALRAEYQKRKLAKEKERFFDQNGGQILYHQIMSKQVDTLKIFTQEDLKKATNDFDKSREVGKGGHGTVYKGILKDNKEVAVKRSKIMNVAETDEFVQEIIILSQTNHRNVVRLLGCCLEVEVPMLVYEFIPNGTLFHFIHRNYGSPPPSLDTRIRVAQESAEALAYLHLSMNRPIVHGDVKSMNILLDENYMAKVTDFGASRMLPKDEVQFMTLVQGTMGYLDPEYLQERKLTEKSDVYSFGVVLLELITGKTAIYHDGPMEAKNLASSFLLAMKDGSLDAGILDASIVSAWTETLLGEVTELASMCLSTRGKERPSMTQVADKLKALRSTWREKLVLEHGQSESLVIGSSPAALMLRVPPPLSMFSTGAQISEVGIETPR